MELKRATQDRHHAWRTPVLATSAADGMPNARTVVLREVDDNLAQLRFYTDARSAKVAELDNQGVALLVFWSKRLNWQLRVRAAVSIHVTGSVVDDVWARVSQSAAAGDYLSSSTPGVIIDVSSAVQPAKTPVTPSLASPVVSAPNHHLVVLSAHVQEIDWLELARSGHRRARLRADSWDWLAP